jgi:hypothetical protein
MKVDLDTVLKAVEDEPELPGIMPDEMFNVLSTTTDRNVIEETLRIAVRLTKHGIRERIIERTNDG